MQLSNTAFKYTNSGKQFKIYFDGKYEYFNLYFSNILILVLFISFRGSTKKSPYGENNEASFWTERCGKQNNNAQYLGQCLNGLQYIPTIFAQAFSFHWKHILNCLSMQAEQCTNSCFVPLRTQSSSIFRCFWGKNSVHRMWNWSIFLMVVVHHNSVEHT